MCLKAYGHSRNKVPLETDETEKDHKGVRNMQLTKTRRLTIAGMLIAVGVLLPYFTAHAFGVQGTMFLPMHLPVLLTGFLSGPIFGMFAGVLTPLISSLMTGMPPTFPMLPIMMAELATYGLVSGLLYEKAGLVKVRFGIYPALVGAMIAGRVVYGLMFWLLTLTAGQLKALSVWAAAVTGLPGIIIQLILVPIIVMAVKKGKRMR
jgi:uncharacterized membrane protein